ncbi:MAG: alkyl hydroperoxide reductase [Proteobacteria bacterium ST_bin12]|nr:MAG: alkyl hydroperoxide reductase [Proteobacteria bacterium ST_bin12]
MSLQLELDAVAEQIKQKAPPAALASIEKANDELAKSPLANLALKIGDSIPAFELPDASGKLIKSADLLKQGPILLTFYRGEWCPFCNVALKGLYDYLPAIKAKGANLIAISPQTPDYSAISQNNHAPKIPVLSDLGNKVAREFGLVFTLSESLRPIYSSFGIDLTAHNGDSSFELPVPATYLISSNGIVLERFIDVDYRKRIEPKTALSWLEKI